MINCDHCGMIFKFPSQLERHFSRKYPCFTNLPPQNNTIECGNIEVVNVKNTVVDDKNTVCHKCNKTLSTKSSLKRHLNVCNGCHKLQCPTCLKMFSSASSKSQHISKVDCKPPDGLLCKEIQEKPHRQSVYLLIEREFLVLKKNVFKIGRSENVSNRAKQYPNGSQLLVVLPCIDCKVSEKRLKDMFEKNFIHRSDIGSEYFEGTPDVMIQMFINNVEARF